MQIFHIISGSGFSYLLVVKACQKKMEKTFIRVGYFYKLYFNEMGYLLLSNALHYFKTYRTEDMHE